MDSRSFFFKQTLTILSEYPIVNSSFPAHLLFFFLKKTALDNAKYVTPTNGHSRDIVNLVLQASQKTFIATPLTTNIFDNDTKQPTFHQALARFDTLNKQAQEGRHHTGQLIIKQPDTLLSPLLQSTFGITKPSFSIFFRCTTRTEFRQMFTPWVPGLENTLQPTTLKAATFSRPYVLTVLTLDTSKNFSSRPHCSHQV